MVSVLWAAGCFQGLLVVARFVLNLLNFIPAAVCVYHTAPTEHCEVDNKSYHILGNQQAGNTINYIGTLVEDTNSILLIAVIFSWKVFRLKHFIRALPRVGYFWIWCLLCATSALSFLYVDIVHGKDHKGNVNVQGVALISETILLTILASAINFITNQIYLNWVKKTFRDNSFTQSIYKRLFLFVLGVYFIRNLGLFMYDTALVSLSISLVKGKKVQGSRDWDSLLLLLTATFRGSFAKFFFQKIFQGQQLPEVCEKEETEISLLNYEAEVSSQRRGRLDSNDNSCESIALRTYRTVSTP
ncbi:PREDICTED: uncharacterized protein LOC107354345 isoform X1 [Acropora digitifera]|uniref:uncharacterized protein LOC107354345 isoform X1 n=1 Tax=Acropora digitifera TaxID=70779 RepID=UPI00077B0C08|nr:PREDICTED: uncharacterized protein LOC107354345 isoform X1 [Acropora digitifera]